MLFLLGINYITNTQSDVNEVMAMFSFLGLNHKRPLPRFPSPPQTVEARIPVSGCRAKSQDGQPGHYLERIEAAEKKKRQSNGVILALEIDCQENYFWVFLNFARLNNQVIFEFKRRFRERIFTKKSFSINFLWPRN